MPSKNVPHLCGGIFFDLLLETKKDRRKARNKLQGGSDGLTAPNLYIALASIVNGEDTETYQGETIEKCVSNYKKCLSSTGDYVPFTDPATRLSFHASYKRKDPAIFEKTVGFIDQFLNTGKCAWLVKSLLKIMQEDTLIPNGTEIAVGHDKTMPVSELHTTEQIIFLPFFLSVFDYVLQYFPDCESGRPTFESWYFQATPKSEWKMKDSIKESLGNISGDIVILMDFSIPDTATPPHESRHEESEIYEDKYAEAEVVDAPINEKQQTNITFIRNQTNIGHDESKTFNIEHSNITFNL